MGKAFVASGIIRLRCRQPVGTACWGAAFAQGSSPTLFRISYRNLPLLIGVDPPAIFFVLVPVLLVKRMATSGMSRQATGPGMFAIVSSIARGLFRPMG